MKLLVGKGVKKSYSQFGEDAILQNLLRGKRGLYVDVGAYHPTLYSNTYAFYRRGWSGVAIDPNPYSQQLFKYARPRDKFILAGVGKPAVLPYFEYDDPACNSIGEPAATRKDLHLIRKTQIRVEPLSEVVKNLEHIDLLNVDVEGMDMEVLASYDWRIMPTVIAIEGKVGDTSYEHLLSKGYRFTGLAGLTMIFTLPSHPKSESL